MRQQQFKIHNNSNVKIHNNQFNIHNNKNNATSTSTSTIADDSTCPQQYHQPFLTSTTITTTSTSTTTTANSTFPQQQQELQHPQQQKPKKDSRADGSISVLNILNIPPPPFLHFCTAIPLVSVGQDRP